MGNELRNMRMGNGRNTQCSIAITLSVLMIIGMFLPHMLSSFNSGYFETEIPEDAIDRISSLIASEKCKGAAPCTRHHADLNGGYGLMAPLGMQPSIDGLKSLGEWDDAKYDIVEVSGTTVMNISVKHTVDNMYVCVEVLADGLGNAEDYCEIAFDSNHDGSSLESTDKKFKIFNDETCVDYEGSGGTWVEDGANWNDGANSTPVVYEFEIEIENVWGNVIDDGNISGFCVHIYSSNVTGTGDSGFGYWPDKWVLNAGENPEPNPINDTREWGDLFYNRPRLVVNEVSSFGAGNDEWIELYNSGSDIDLNGINITDQDGNIYQFNSTIFPYDCYLVLKSGIGTNDSDFSDGKGTIYLGGVASWNGNTWNNNGDDILLKYGGNDCGIDYMNYTNGVTYGDSCPIDTKSENIWSIVSGLLSPPNIDESVSRIPNGIDTNDSQDWVVTTSVTEGEENAIFGTMGYGIVAPSSTAIPTINGSIETGEWDDAKYDSVEIEGVPYFTVDTKINGSYIYVAVILDTTFNDELDNNDLCALTFDVDHDGGTSPQNDDWYVQCKWSGGSVQSTCMRGNGTEWVPQPWPGGWKVNVSDNGSSGPEVYEFKVSASVVLGSEVEGNVSGFGVYVKEHGGASVTAIYWPDAFNPSESLEDIPDSWGNLIYKRPMLLINEVSSNGTGNQEWIELYNNCSTPIKMEDVNITDQDGNDSTLPAVVIPPYGYLHLKSGNGINDLNFSDGCGTVYIGKIEFWSDMGDDVLLRYNKNNCTFDYMQYGSGFEIDDHPLDTASNSDWIFDTPSLLAPTSTQYLHRTPNGKDTNRSSDWTIVSQFIETKTLYLHDDGTYVESDNIDFLNTTPPAMERNMNEGQPTGGDYDEDGHPGITLKTLTDPKINRRYRLWNLTPVFARDFNVLEDVNISIWTMADKADKNLTVKVELYDWDGISPFPDGATLIGSDTTNNLNWPDEWWETNFTIASVYYTISAENQLVVNVTRADDDGVRMYLAYDTLTYDSYINISTDTYVNITWAKTYDTSDIEKTVFSIDEDVIVRANVTDPFGSYDISGANITVRYPNGSIIPSINDTAMILEDIDHNSPSAWKLFNYTISNAVLTETGTYAINISGIESNGVIDNATITFDVISNEADHLEYVSGDDQSGIVNTTLPTDFKLKVVDQSGNPINGYEVNFTIFSVPIDAANYYFIESGNQWHDDISDVNGIVNVTLHLGTKVGNYWINASNPLLPGIAGPKYNNTLNATAYCGQADHLEYVSGDDQSGTVNTTLLNDFMLKVVDQSGNPISGYEVNFTIYSVPIDAANYYFIESGNQWYDDISDVNGIVNAKLHLGTRVGNYWINASNALLPGAAGPKYIDTLNATAYYGQADHLVYVSGNEQSSTIMASLANAFVARVVDKYSNNVSGYRVEWAITDMPIGAIGQSLSEIYDISDGSGLVETTLTLGIKIGNYNVTVTNDTLPGTPIELTYSATAKADSVARIEINPYPSIILEMGDSQIFTATSYDAFENVNTSWVDDWTMENNLGSLTDTGGYTIEYNAEKIGIDYINVSCGSVWNRTRINIVSGESPVINGIIPNQEKEENYGSWVLDLSSFATDSQDPPSALKWFVTGDNSSLYTISGENIVGNHFLIFATIHDAYGSDRITIWLVDSDGYTDSQELWVNITPVNNPPTIYNVPDLVVHYDDPYTFNLDIYVNDVDNPKSELIITTNDLTHITINGLNMTFLYPQSMLGESVYVIINVSDGFATAQDVIKVDITSDYPPKLKLQLPDVTMEEDSTLYSYFDLNDYFDDPDEDALYYSYGFTHITVTINANHTVDFSAPPNWWGIETVTFRAEDPIHAIAEDTIWVTVLPVNDPPTISGVPPFIIHYNHSYSFDLTSYVHDDDNLLSELNITTSNPNNVTVNGLIITLNYPATWNGLMLPYTVPLTIHVSDGMASAFQVITVTVGDNYPPEVVKFLPDIFFYEDTNYTNAFDLDDYFIDVDSSTIFYSSGQLKIEVVIHDNHSVDFFTPTNWYGEERVTFRGTDDMGALVEDSIFVTILPVNDPPIISGILDQREKKGKVWTLDVGLYIFDIDNNITDLMINVDSKYVTVVGHVLIFEYPDDVMSDAVTLTVSDGELNTTKIFSVTILTPSFWDQICWPWSLLIIILAGAIIAVIISKKLLGAKISIIEEVFLVYKDGCLIAHNTRRLRPDVDDDILSAMLTAVQEFVKDSFRDEEEFGLNKLEFGEKKILIEHGKDVYIAVVYSGEEIREMPLRMRKTIKSIEERYSDILEDWDGDLDKLRGTKKMLKSLFSPISPKD